jgi:hypothetical protein
VSTWTQLALVFSFALILEVGWVVAVRLVHLKKAVFLVLTAMGMQTISYLSTLIIVQNNLSMLGGVLGSGLGALIALQFPDRWFRTDDPIV